jgi:hypothetical protein
MTTSAGPTPAADDVPAPGAVVAGALAFRQGCPVKWCGC